MWDTEIQTQDHVLYYYTMLWHQAFNRSFHINFIYEPHLQRHLFLELH